MYAVFATFSIALAERALDLVEAGINAVCGDVLALLDLVWPSLVAASAAEDYVEARRRTRARA